MAQPPNTFEFATDANYSTGPDVGTPTKVAPSAGEIDSGFVRGTAAVAQHMNWLFGQVQEWTDYLAGLSSDSEFLGDLEARDWAFGGDVSVAGALGVGGVITALALVTSGNVSVGAGIGATGNISTNGNLIAGGTLTVAGNTTLNGDLTLGAGDNITMASRSITKELPLHFSPAIQFVATWEMRSYTGGASSGYGFHVFGDKLAGSYVTPVLEFSIPTGATLTEVRIGRRMSQAGGAHDFGPFTLDEINGGVNSAAVTNDIAPAYNNPGVTTGNTITMTVTSPAASVFSTRYKLTIEPSVGSTFSDPDCIFKVEIVYTTTHVDPND